MVKLNYWSMVIIILSSIKLINCSLLQQQKYFWQKLLNVSDETLAQIFIKNYNLNLNDRRISRQCYMDLNFTITSLIHHRKTWAFKLFNSWSSSTALPPGLFIGTLTDYGDYDQCISIENDHIWPKYCIIDMKFPMPQPLPRYHNLYHKTLNLIPPNNNELNDTIYHYLNNLSSYFYYTFIRKAICLPESCSTQDIGFIIEKSFGLEFGLELNKIFCTKKSKESSWTPSLIQMIAIVVFTTIALITIIAAIYDYINQNKKSYSFYENILLTFSPINNVKKLLFSNGQEDNLACIHGIRFLAICMVIVGHTLALNNLNSFRQIFMRRKFMTTLWIHPFLKGFYSVDTFFYLSGFLLSYMIMKLTKGGNNIKQFSTIGYLLFRYIRLTPQLIIYLLLLTLIPPIFDGPIWQALTDRITVQCKKTWWMHLLYIQNIVDPNNLCGIHIWYLAADMQLYWLSLLPTILILKYRRIGLIIIKSMIVISICLISIIIYLNDLPPGYVATTENDFINEDGSLRQFLWLNFQPWSHLNVYLIGYLFGYYCSLKNDDQNNQIQNKINNFIIWPFIIIGYLFTIYSCTPWLYGRPFDPIWSAILWPLNHTIWALLLTAIIYISFNQRKQSSFISKLLSWNALRPISRITYSIYLTHFLVIYIDHGTRRNLIEMSLLSWIYHCSSILIISFIVAFIFNILFETPIINIINLAKNKLIISSNTTTTTKTITNVNEFKLINVE